MKLEIEHSDLVKAMNSAASVVDKRNVVPILGHVKIATNGDSVLFTTTNLEAEIQIKKPARVTGEGVTTVSANLLKDIAARMPAGSLVSMEIKDHDLIVKAGRQRYKIATLDADDFPELSAQGFESEQQLDGETFAHILSRVKTAMSKEETRYYLKGIAMQYRDDALVFVATDGHRLVKESITGEIVQDVIIPDTAVHVIERLAGETDTVTLHVSETKIKLDAGDTVFTSKVIDGTFPDWTRVVPPLSDNVMSADAGQINIAASGVAVVSDQRTKSVKLTMSPNSANLSVRGADNFGEGDVDCEWNGEDGFAIGLNAQYLSDVLKLADKGTIRLHMSRATEPVRVVFDESPETVAVVMPMMVNS